MEVLPLCVMGAPWIQTCWICLRYWAANHSKAPGLEGAVLEALPWQLGRLCSPSLSLCLGPVGQPRNFFIFFALWAS